MKEVFYKPPNGWIGDLIPFSHEGRFYLYYLHDKRSGENEDEYGYCTTWNLLITEDGKEIEDVGVVLPIGGEEDVDRSCYTGCVLQGKDERFHMFYTAQNHHNPKFCRDGRSIQYIMHATSNDLIHWEKHYQSVMQADESLYEVFDWRDPHVFYNEEEGCYNMLLAARKQGASQKNGGCIALCRSDDLWGWEVGEPFYAPNTYLTHECPDLFRLGEWWYLIYSTFSERFITHYRMSRSLSGPWTAPVEDSFDGRAFYAAKTAEKDGERWAFAWTPSKRGSSDYGQWEWGGTLIMHKLDQLPDGRLTSGIPVGIRNSFTQEQMLCTPRQGKSNFCSPIRIRAEDAAAALTLRELPKQCLIEADIEFSSGIRNFGIAIRQDETYADGYYFRLEPFYNRVVFDMWPRRVPGVNQWYLDGDKPFALELERPYQMTHLRRIHLCLLVDGDICTLYADNCVALTARTYDLTGEGWSFFAFDGSIQVENIRLLTREQQSE